MSEMRLAMKIYGLLISLIMVFALIVGARNSYALDYEGMTMTCSGEYTVYGAQNFFFSYTDENGNCGIKSFYANSSGEAYNCAMKACKECELKDLTGLYQFGSAMPGYNPGEQYCPKK